MPFTFAGCGTAICRAGPVISWGEPQRSFRLSQQTTDFDAVLCFVVFHIPLAPISAMHVFNWDIPLDASQLLLMNVIRFECVPIRLTGKLFARALFWRLLPPGFLVSLLLILMATVGENIPDQIRILLGVAGGILALALIGLLITVHRMDVHERRIRYGLGRHEAGSSDPAMWIGEKRANLVPPKQKHGANTDAEAVRALLQRGEFADALWAARACAALDGREDLTDEVLNNPEVRKSVAQVIRNPPEWKKLMTRG